MTIELLAQTIKQQEAEVARAEGILSQVSANLATLGINTLEDAQTMLIKKTAEIEEAEAEKTKLLAAAEAIVNGINA
jgi:hypothetical protein